MAHTNEAYESDSSSGSPTPPSTPPGTPPPTLPPTPPPPPPQPPTAALHQPIDRAPILADRHITSPFQPPRDDPLGPAQQAYFAQRAQTATDLVLPRDVRRAREEKRPPFENTAKKEEKKSCQCGYRKLWLDACNARDAAENELDVVTAQLENTKRRLREEEEDGKVWFKLGNMGFTATVRLDGEVRQLREENAALKKKMQVLKENREMLLTIFGSNLPEGVDGGEEEDPYDSSEGSSEGSSEDSSDGCSDSSSEDSSDDLFGDSSDNFNYDYNDSFNYDNGSDSDSYSESLWLSLTHEHGDIHENDSDSASDEDLDENTDENSDEDLVDDSDSDPDEDSDENPEDEDSESNGIKIPVDCSDDGSDSSIDADVDEHSSGTDDVRSETSSSDNETTMHSSAGRQKGLGDRVRRPYKLERRKSWEAYRIPGAWRITSDEDQLYWPVQEEFGLIDRVLGDLLLMGAGLYCIGGLIEAVGLQSSL
ncbi:hypothetical protein B0H66DRAFT_598742 [Apodospora peruviana]|uniref:Uncharacterized protein n=1 Tax=Apodospora peruviana TaxID=516989 RepID=A0AAE0ITZ6_9PEZI|nr:hypothetical protein B0H66DRAFT_598742 [Apodospora peruviana]